MVIITEDSGIDFGLSNLIYVPTNHTFFTISGVSMTTVELTTTFYDGSYGETITVDKTALVGLIYIEKYVA